MRHTDGFVLVSLLMLMLGGCGDDRRRKTVINEPNEVVLTMKDQITGQPRHVLSTENTLLVTIEAVSLVPDLVIHEAMVDTTFWLPSMRVASSDGGLGVDNQPFDRGSFRLIGTPNNQLLSIPVVQDRADFIIFADTSEVTKDINILATTTGPPNSLNLVNQGALIEREMRVTLRNLLVSSSRNPTPHYIPTSYIDFTIILDPPPVVSTVATRPTRDYRASGKGAADVLAEFVIAEHSGQADTDTDIVRISARMLTAGVTRLTLVDETGARAADTQNVTSVSDSVDFEFTSPLRINSSRSRRLSIVGDIANSPNVGSVVILEVRTIRLRSKTGQGFAIEGPVQANGQPVVFSALY